MTARLFNFGGKMGSRNPDACKRLDNCPILECDFPFPESPVSKARSSYLSIERMGTLWASLHQLELSTS